jgi:hypothetical protein
MRRLPPRTRVDFDAHRAQFCLKSGLVMSDFALLAYTEAKLPSEGFSIVNPLTDLCGPCEFLLEVAGYRHYADGLKEPLSVGQPLQFVAEPSNEWDPNAVRVEADSKTSTSAP